MSGGLFGYRHMQKSRRRQMFCMKPAAGKRIFSAGQSQAIQSGFSSCDVNNI